MQNVKAWKQTFLDGQKILDYWQCIISVDLQLLVIYNIGITGRYFWSLPGRMDAEECCFGQKFWIRSLARVKNLVEVLLAAVSGVINLVR